MSKPPTISVLMPVYNAERYLAAAVESILSQTFDDFEFLIVDDGSTDSSLLILRAFAARDARIKLTARANTGYVVALNEMLVAAKGEFIARMDADDIALPRRLEIQIAFLRQHPHVACVGGGYQVIDETGAKLVELFPPQANADCQQAALHGHTPICHPCALFRKSVAQSLGGYDRALGPAEDLDLWLRMGEVGELANVPDVILQYRMHSKSVSSEQQDVQLEKMQLGCRNAWARRGIAGTFETQPWRPDSTPASQASHYLQCGWWAWNSHENKTAARYGAKVLTTTPFNRQGWILLGAVVRQAIKQRVRLRRPERMQYQ